MESHGDLLAQLRPHVESGDVDAITDLLLGWPVQNEQWAECVEMRIAAPTTTDEQRTRLRDAVRDYRRAHPHTIGLRDLAQAFPKPKPEPDPAQPIALDLSVLQITGIHDAAAQVAARLDEVPDKWIAAMLAYADACNLKLQDEYWEYYRDEQSARWHDGKPIDFDAFLHLVANNFIRVGPPAMPEQIDAIRTMFPRPLAPEVEGVYRTLGGWNGAIGATSSVLRLIHPVELAAARVSDRRHERLEAASLRGMARWSWGNDRPELDAGGASDAVLAAADGVACLGWVGDGTDEAHAYIVEIRPDCFALHAWHQDRAFTTPDLDQPGLGLVELLTRMLDVLRVLDEDDAPLYVDDLAAAVRGG